MRRRYSVALASALALALSWFAGPAHAAGGQSFTWIGNSQSASADNHSWTNAQNWQPNGVPGDGDLVTIAPPDNLHCTVNINGVPTVTLASLSISAGSDPGCGSASITGGQLTITGAFSWNGGTLSTPTTLSAGAVGTLTGSNHKLNVLSAALDVAGTLTLSGVADSGASNQGGFRIVNPNVLHVLSGGTLNSDGANAVQLLSCCVNPAKITNDGTLHVSSGDFIVHGVQVDQNGTLSAASNGRLVSDGEPITAGNGATYTGTGSWFITNTARAKFTGTQNLGSGFHLELGGAAVNAGAELGGTATLTGSGVFDWTGGTVEGNLTIAHGMTVHVHGAHNTANANNNGKQVLAGQDSLSANAASTLTNHGVITVDQGANILTASQAQLINASDGAVTFAPGTQITTLSCCLNPNKIVNHGHLTVPAGTASDPVVLDGVAYQSDATTSIATGRQLVLHLAPSSLTSGTVSGGGALTVTAPTAISGTVTVGSGTKVNLQVGGSLNGTSTLSGAGSVAWTGGSVSGAVKLATTGGITISGTAAKYLANVNGGATPSTLNLAAKTTFAAGTSATHNVLDLGTSTLTFSSTTSAAAYTDIRSGKVINTGTFSVAPGAGGRVDVGGANGVTNRGAVKINSGTLYVTKYTQTAGSTTLASGTALAGYNSYFLVSIAGGTLAGRGTVRGPVSNSAGQVAPGGSSSVGTLHITGSYTQGASGRLLLDLAASSRDVLAVGGTATLHGSLAAHNMGSYHPSLGAKATVLTTPSLQSSLSCMTSSGTGSTGTGAGHWAGSPTTTKLALIWRSGARTSC